jgi:hypothetical protein
MGVATRCGWMLTFVGGLFVAFMLAGCGGGSKMSLTSPTPNSSLPGSFSGSVWSLSPDRTTSGGGSMFDYPAGATVKLSATDSNGNVLSGGYTATAYTNVAGGYQFANVPAGTYRVDVTATAPESTTPLTGFIANVQVIGGIPTLMANVIVGAATSQVTFTGTVTQNGAAASGAIVSLSVESYPYTPPNTVLPANTISFITPTYTLANGTYSITVPNGAHDYLLCAYSKSSQITPDVAFSMAPISGVTTTIIPAGIATETQNFSLTTAITPILPTLYMDISSTTMPDATASANTQALISQLAVARALKFSSAKMKVLQLRMERSLSRSGTGTGGSVENDVIAGQNSAPGSENYVMGYNFYRGTAASGTFVEIGTTTDPFQYIFIDNDPALTPSTPVYYTADCYAANGTVSDPAPSILAQPLPAITNVSPGAPNATGQTVTGTTATLSWTAVPGALSYAVLVFDEDPTFNTIPDANQTHANLGNVTSCVLSTTGTFWWAVAAYNNTEPAYATASSFSAYYKLMIVP